LERRVVDVLVRERRLRWPIAAHFEAAIRGQTVRGIERRAKYILIRFDGGTVILHLGMSGSLRLVKPDVAPKTHDHWDIRVDNGWVLRFHDPRRFGSLLWTETDPALHPLLKNLAPEPLTAEFDGDYLYRVTRKRSVAIKQFIMNSQVVVGVGNIYASEALFRARIAPRRAASRVSKRSHSHRPSRMCSARPSKSAAPRCATTSMPTAHRDISGRSYSFMSARERLAACASPP
jgi:formamidopyrimidine-DNA glycosylase